MRRRAMVPRSGCVRGPVYRWAGGGVVKGLAVLLWVAFYLVDVERAARYLWTTDEQTTLNPGRPSVEAGSRNGTFVRRVPFPFFFVSHAWNRVHPLLRFLFSQPYCRRSR